MTEGSITGHLLAYAGPMILGNILQLTYNAVDSIIVGKFAGEKALAAVSVSNPIMTIIILGVSGISIGASVLMSRFYGADDPVNLKRELSTTILFGALCSIVVFLGGILLARDILVLMAVPAQVLDLAEKYLKTVFIGFLFTFQYNIITAALRSVGDAKTPVIYLGISAALNCLLDLVFVRDLKLGVSGAGYATVISQALSAMLCFIHVYRTQPALRLTGRDWVVDHALLKQTLSSGSLSALQQAGQPIGKVLIQSVINSQGITAIAAFNAVCRMDDFACIPAQSIGHSIMTCVAQNRGAKKPERIRESFAKGLRLSLYYFPIICTVTLLFKEPFVRLLAPDNSEQIVSMGVEYLSIKAWFFIMPCIVNAIQGYFRGMDKMGITLAATLLQISIRTVVVYIWVPSIGIKGEAFGCLLGWLCQMFFEYGLYFYYRKQGLKKDQL